MGLTDRAGRWATEQVGRHGRTVSEVADDLACDWHTVNDAVIAYGTALVETIPTASVTRRGRVGRDVVRPEGGGGVSAGRPRSSTSAGRLLDIVAGRDSVEPCAWFAARDSRGERDPLGDARSVGPYRMVFDTMLPDATQVADPFHVVRLANTTLDECRRRVQNETLGHRGRKTDPLYRCRRLVIAPTNGSASRPHEAAWAARRR